MKKIGMLTGGGDCPGLNAVIRAVVKKSRQYNWQIIGIKDGWYGLITGEMEIISDYSVSGILPKGGTIIGTSRTNPAGKTSLTTTLSTVLFGATLAVKV